MTARLDAWGLAALPDPILVVGGYGYRNVGDEAILAGLLRVIGPDRRRSVLSRAPAETAALHGVPALGPRDLPRALRVHRSLVIGGGGLFGSGMGRLGRGLAAFGLFASAAGLEVAVAGVGVEAPLPWTSRAPLRRLAPRLADLSVRDAASAEILCSLGIEARVVEDFSVALEPAPPQVGDALLAAMGLDPDRPTVGLFLTGLGGEGSAVTRRLAGAVADLAEALPEVQLCAVPMSQHPFVPAHNDLLLAQRLRAAVPRVAVLEGLHHPAVILALVGRLSAVVAMRYHAMRFAHRLGVPLVAIPYAPKCHAWLEESGLPALRLDKVGGGATLAAAVRDALPARLARTA